MEKNDILKNALLDAKTELNTTYLDGFLIDVADLVFEERSENELLLLRQI